MAEPSKAPRKLRADAQRNRERLLEVAREAFMQHGAEASLDDIAKRSGVGSATLYRHYPTREALIEAVYRRDVEKLGTLGDELIDSKPPVEALRAWMYLFVEHTDEKHILAPALTNSAYESAGVVIQNTIKKLVERAVKSGEIRQDTVPFDLLRAIIGVSQMRYMPEWQESAKG